VPYDLYTSPGHLVRRVQQIANAIFTEEVADRELTPPQFALLVALHRSPGADQISLSREVGIDRSTVADVVGRLRARGLVSRSRDVRDARRNTVRLTPQGTTLVETLAPAVLNAQERLLTPLDDAERAELLRLLTKVVIAHDARFEELIPGGNAGRRVSEG
jgi:MarR family transcriptional regulator, lower aerobic nicotinate degradation pathway regulator